MIRVILLLLLAGCGRYPELNQPGDGWDDHLTPYVYEFADDIEAYGVPLGRIGMIKVIREDTAMVEIHQSDDESLVGICMFGKYDERHVRGEIYVISDLDEDMLRHTMYHELTHCAYEMDHWGELGDIQHPYINIELIPWQERKDRHFKELKRLLENLHFTDGDGI